jgi:hypothetical protein
LAFVRQQLRVGAVRVDDQIPVRESYERGGDVGVAALDRSLDLVGAAAGVAADVVEDVVFDRGLAFGVGFGVEDGQLEPLLVEVDEGAGEALDVVPGR